MCRTNNLSPECLSVNIKAGEGPLLGTKYKNKLNYKYIYLYTYNTDPKKTVMEDMTPGNKL